MQLERVILKADFSHVAALQDDIERRSRAINLAASGLSKAVESQFITTEDATEEFKKFLS